MIKYERKRLIIEILKKSEIAYIDEIVEASGVSASTVRRDIDSLVKAGQVMALRGGAITLNDRLSELPTAEKALINKDEKTAIAAAAAKLVSDGDTIYLDSGTTTLQMFPFLQGLRLQVITSNTHLLSLVPDAGMRVTILGGDYLPNIGSIAGSMTERLLNDMFFDKAFIGASGCSVKAGISTFDIREAAKKRIVHDNSNESFVLVDKTKFGKSTLHKALDLSECVLIVDEYHELLASAKSYIVADPLGPDSRSQDRQPDTSE
jgi:DeoR family fructose operon transcriptional repressor